jgi:hypothetical protein
MNARSIVQFNMLFIFFLKIVENPQNLFEIFLEGISELQHLFINFLKLQEKNAT